MFMNPFVCVHLVHKASLCIRDYSILVTIKGELHLFYILKKQQVYKFHHTPQMYVCVLSSSLQLMTLD